MPFAGFDDFADCRETMMDEEGHDQEAAENICGALQAEEKSDHGSVEELRTALDRGAGLIADVGVDLVSGVDVPAVDSKWVMTKDAADTEGHDFRANSPILLSKDDSDQRISYAAAMIPREPDKEGDVVATPTVERAAHDFIKQQGGVDTDHSLIDGEGDVVESWVLKDERTFDLPGGETETYGPGTWMVGIEWGKEAWDRIKAGELTGLSIYGMAEHVALDKAATCAECGDALSASKSQNADTHKGDGTESGDMAPDQTGDDGGDAGDAGDSTDIGEVAASVDDLAGTVESLKEAVETDKDGEQEAAATIAEAFDDIRPGDVLDIVEAAASRGVDAVLEAAENAEASADEEAKEDDEDEDDDEEEMEESVDKRADEANLGKGGDATETAAKGVETDGASGGTGLSYRAIAEEKEGA